MKSALQTHQDDVESASAALSTRIDRLELRLKREIAANASARSEAAIAESLIVARVEQLEKRLRDLQATVKNRLIKQVKNEVMADLGRRLKTS